MCRVSLRSALSWLGLALGVGVLAWSIPIALDLRSDSFTRGLLLGTVAAAAVASVATAHRGAGTRSLSLGAALAVGGAALVWLPMVVLLLVFLALGGDLNMS
jgi:hypothetical protein